MSLSPPPSREKIPVVKEPGGTFAVLPQAWLKWFSMIRDEISATVTAATTWAGINKTGSNITDIQVRKHSDLQNINSATYAHPTQSQLDELTGGGATILHSHNSDRIYARNCATHRV